MIHCIGLNPAIDQTVMLDRLEPGAVIRASDSRLDPGGKAVNVASVLADWGMAATVHGLLGQDNAAVFQALFTQKGITDRMVRVPGATRTNIKILEQDGRTTDVNLPGFDADNAALDRVRAGLDVAQAGELAVVSGSQPAALPPEATASLVAELAARGARVVMDVSGAPLRAALASATLPFAIKPNRHELEEVTGTDLSDRAALADAAQGLLARGIALVVVSLGTDGALFLTANDAVQVRPVALSTGSAVGAGDAMVAGLTAALAQGLPLPDLARQATAFSGAKLQNPGPHLPSRDAVRDLAAQVTPIPLADWITGA